MSGIFDGVRVLEVGGRAAAVCGRLFAQLGADVIVIGAGETAAKRETPPAQATEAIAFEANKRFAPLDLNSDHGRAAFNALADEADLVVIDLHPREIDALGIGPGVIAARNPRVVVATITPFGLSGARRNYRGGDLIATHSSGVARLLVGHVDDPEAEPPVRAAGEQSDFIAGLTAACAAAHALYQQQRTGVGEAIDVSAQEAMSLMAARELAMPAFDGQPAPRAGRGRGGSAVIPVLPARDGYVAVSPRETHQWERWLAIMGNPAWGREPRFATRAQRTANYPALFERMADWSRTRTCAELFAICQAEHVPCFPFGKPSDMLDEPQLAHRGFFATANFGGMLDVALPMPPFGLPPGDYSGEFVPPTEGSVWLTRSAAEPLTVHLSPAGGLPLEGVRVLDFSWVIAGPTSTRYLALMGAQVIKIEAPERPDTGRTSELHDVLGQSKLALSIDLRAAGALAAVRELLKTTDVVVENFATGVMERLGLGYDDLRRIRPDIVLLSASGLGRTGPGASWVAYGNLLSAYSGFAALNGPRSDEAREEPRTGLAWADPLCGLFMAFGVAAALRNRDRGGGGRHIDFSMLEGLLWTMPGALIQPQTGGGDAQAEGNGHPEHVPHDAYRAAGEDRWLAIAVTTDAQWGELCAVVPGLEAMASLDEGARGDMREAIDRQLQAWTLGQDPIEAMELLQGRGVPATASYTTNDMFGDAHLWERGFYKPVQGPDDTLRFLPGLPWRWGDGSMVAPRAAPGQGAQNEYVMRELAGLGEEEIEALRAAGAFGR